MSVVRAALSDAENQRLRDRGVMPEIGQWESWRVYHPARRKYHCATCGRVITGPSAFRHAKRCDQYHMDRLYG